MMYQYKYFKLYYIGKISCEVLNTTKKFVSEILMYLRSWSTSFALNMVISDVVAAGMIIIGVLEPVNNQKKAWKNHTKFMLGKNSLLSCSFSKGHTCNCWTQLQCITPVRHTKNFFVHEFFCNLHNIKYMNILIWHFYGIRLCFWGYRW